MPPRKVRNNDSSSDDETLTMTGTPVAPVLMSETQLASLLAAFSSAQAEANRKLVESLLTSHSGTPPGVNSGTTPSSYSGNLVKCTSRFDGSSEYPEAVEAFIDAVEMFMDCASVSDEMALRGLPMLLHGQAAVWWRGIRHEVTSWSEAVKRLRSMYGIPRPPYKLYRDVFAAEQGLERADVFIVRVRSLLSKLPYQLPEEARLDMIYGLLHKRIRKRLPRDAVSDIESLIGKSRSIEESLSENSASPSSSCLPTKAPPALDESAQQHVAPGSSSTPPPPVRAARAPRAKSPRSDQCVSKSDNSDKKLFCVYCKVRGHVRDSCDKLSKRSLSTNSGTGCYNCGEKGHVRVNCPKGKQDSAGGSTTNVKTENVFSSVYVDSKKSCSDFVIDNNKQGRPIVRVCVEGYQGTALLDTAARRSIASYSLYSLLKRIGSNFRTETMSLKLADGIVRNSDVLLTIVNVQLASLSIPIEFIILPEAVSNDTLLGIDFITKAKMVIDFSNWTWRTMDQPRTLYTLSWESERAPIQCASANVLRTDEGAMLSGSERSTLENLLCEYSDIFDIVGEPTPFAEHHIDTGDHPPIALPPYRLTPAKKEIMHAELDKMLAEDVIEECESAWAAPCVLVPKRNGTYRFCVDYRKLNAVTKTDAYPMPRIDELLQSTKKGCVMSSLDLRSGYWQVSTADRDKTAFVTPFGTYRFKRMPFGLKNSPATFQRLIDRFRSGSTLGGKTILGYLDDLLVISEDLESHIADLRAVFERLRMYKLRANREKCVFARDRLKYLGHVISHDGISPDEEKVSAVIEMKEPTTLQQLRTFLQTCSWFRKFIPEFAKVAEPLTRLTKKSQTWKWGKDQANAFLQLKSLLASPPILTQPDYLKPFILRTDASDFALGAALLQGESPQDEHPIEYASRLLTPAERNYSTTEREALAVVWAVERFRGYIDGHQVCVRSDHQPLKWLFTLKSPTGRLVRWALKLQSFDLQIEYTPGKANVVADTLSRPVIDSTSECGVCPVTVDIPRWDATSTREAQLSDPEVAKILTGLESADELSGHRWSDRGYLINQGVLYRYVEDSDAEEPQLVVPESLRSKVMYECHDSPTAAHGGIQKTLHRISQHFYFPGMRKYITDYLKTCTECQRYKSSNLKPPGLLQTPVPAQRFEIIAVDLFGPLPKGPQGERWVLIVEDTASKWVELFALSEATAEICAKTLVGEIFMRYGLPRRMISDNGVQFVADVMQKALFVLGVKQNLIPLYHPEANPVERRNRDLKVHLAILVEGNHKQWPEVLPFVRFALNSSFTISTGSTPAYLTFGRELRSPLSVQADLRAVIESENLVPQITPYLLKLVDSLSQAKENIEHQQDLRKHQADSRRRVSDPFEEGDLVLMKTHVLSNASKGVTSKFIPKQDGPYVVSKKVSPTTYALTSQKTGEVVGKYHVSALRRYHDRGGECPEPIVPKRRRGRPRKVQP